MEKSFLPRSLARARSGHHRSAQAANIGLGTHQTWGNVSSRPFTVRGTISGNFGLTLTAIHTNRDQVNGGGVFSAAGTVNGPLTSGSGGWFSSGRLQRDRAVMSENGLPARKTSKKSVDCNFLLTNQRILILSHRSERYTSSLPPTSQSNPSPRQ